MRATYRPSLPPSARQRGVATIEFAISVLVALVMLLVVAEVGRLLYSYTILTHAVRDGARFASVNSLAPTGVFEFPPVNNPDADTEVTNLVNYGDTGGMGTPLLPGAAVTVTVGPNATVASAGPGARYIEVVGTYVYAPLFATIPWLWNAGGTDFGMTLTAQNTMRSVN